SLKKTRANSPLSEVSERVALFYKKSLAHATFSDPKCARKGASARLERSAVERLLRRRTGARTPDAARPHAVIEPGDDAARRFLEKKRKDGVQRGAYPRQQQPEGKTAGHLHMLQIAFIDRCRMGGKIFQHPRHSLTRRAAHVPHFGDYSSCIFGKFCPFL